MNTNEVEQALVGLATLLKDITPEQGKPYPPSHCAVIATAVEAIATGLVALIDYVAEKEATMMFIQANKDMTGADKAKLLDALAKGGNKCEPIVRRQCGSCRCHTCVRTCKRCFTHSAIGCYTNTCPNHKVYQPTEWADGK